MLHAGVHTKTCTTRRPTRGLAEKRWKNEKSTLVVKASPSHRAAIKLTGGDEKNKSEHERPQHDNRKKNRLPEQGKAHNNDSCCREEKKHQTSRSHAGLALGKIEDDSRTTSRRSNEKPPHAGANSKKPSTRDIITESLQV